MVARVVIPHVQDVTDSLALTLQLQIGRDFTEPGDIRQIEGAVAIEVANTDFLARRDDLGCRARVELVSFD